MRDARSLMDIRTSMAHALFTFPTVDVSVVVSIYRVTEG